MRTREFTWCINYESVEMDGSDNETFATNVSTTISPELIRKEQERIEFYNTYDVMTGVRIAYTLGGFFGLMVILVLYKSKSKTERALEDPHLAAAAVAEAEEEERQIAAQLEATAYEQLNPPTSRRSRRSLVDTSGVSPRWIRNTKRFSSIAGYATLMDPPIRLSSKIPCSIDEDSPTDDGHVIYDDVYACPYDSHLGVPIRRPSNVTCSSSGSSYLERRGSAVMLGLPTIPAHKAHHHQHHMRRRQSSPLPEQYDFYYPIDIRVIQPTPGGSPCGSERALCNMPPAMKQQLKPRLAPLASISSCNSSLANDYPDLEMQSHASYVSDSVFHDIDEYYDDTDDEIDPFSTDSDEDDDEEEDGVRCRTNRLNEADEDMRMRPCCSQECHRRMSMAKTTTALSTISDESTSTLIEHAEVQQVGRTSASSTRETFDCDMGALGVKLETLERKRGSCGSADGSPATSSPNSPNCHRFGHSASANIAIIAAGNDSQDVVVSGDAADIDVVDVDIGEQNVWSKETLF